MSKFIKWKSLLVAPALLGTTLALSSVAHAADAPSKEATTQASTIGQIENYSNEGLNNSAEQVTSVSELKDVQPTEWAFEALRSLVERYGCIVGYPDRTFRGNRALTRWEFAAGLNACINTVERLIQENVAVLRADIDKLKRLAKEFESELAALGARVDNLEGRVSFLEDHQFSTTTKLQGEVIFAPTWTTNGNFNNNQATFQDRVRLRFNTSFSGKDLLVTRLSAGNAVNGSYNFTAFGGNGNAQTFNIANPATLTQTWQNTQTNNSVNVDWIAYYTSFDFGEYAKFDVYIPANGGLWDDFVPTLNPYFYDADGGQGSLSTFSQENPIYRIGGGAGIGFSYKLGFLDSIIGPSSLSVGYMSGSAANPSQGQGLFNGNSSILAQVNANAFNFINVGFTYSNTYSIPGSPIFGSGGTSGIGLVGTELANAGSVYSGALNRTFNLAPNGTQTNAYGVQAAIKPFDGISLSAFGTYGNVNRIGGGINDIWTYGGGIAFADLFKQGNVLGIFAGVQPYLGVGNSLFLPNVGGPTGTYVPVRTQNPISVEAFYKYQVTDNISVTPGVQWIQNPSQLQNVGSAIVGSVRGTFSF
jgi:hypothetical protein